MRASALEHLGIETRQLMVLGLERWARAILLREREARIQLEHSVRAGRVRERRRRGAHPGQQ